MEYIHDMTTQKKKQNLINSQINEIRSNVKILREYLRAGCYVDSRQEKALNGISSDIVELAAN